MERATIGRERTGEVGLDQPKKGRRTSKALQGTDSHNRNCVRNMIATWTDVACLVSQNVLSRFRARISSPLGG